MTIELRPDRAVFRFSGADAHKLLNDVVTGHVPERDGESGAWWALLSAQGKILAEGLAGFAHDAIWLDVHQSVADDFFKRMKMYRLRAAVIIEDLRESHRVGFAVEATGEIVHADRRGPVSLGWRIIAPLAASEGWTSDDQQHYRAARAARGIAELGPDFAPNEVFAHDIGMDILDGIDFAKGCYVGQEVVSRMKHRGTARRRPVIVSGIASSTGSVVQASGRDAGTIGQVIGDKAVGILRLDRITDVDAVTMDGQAVRVALPDWAPYRFGDTTAEDN